MGNQKATPTKETTLTRPQNSANLATKFPLPTTSAHPLLQLQRKIGNRAVSQLIQAKLKVGKPNDVYEVEADRVADHVMRSPDPIVQLQPEEKKEETAQAKANVQQISPLVQREEEKKEETAQAKPIAPITPLVQRQETEEKKEETVQKQAADEKKEETAQMLQRQATDENKEETVQKQEDKKEETAQAKGADTPEVTPHLETRIQTMRGGGQPLPDHTRSFFESRMGYDLGGVRVHTDSQADEVSRGLNAQAFTIGQNIFFAGGRYEPQTNQGKWLLAHELTHTVQQTPSTPAAQTKLTPAPVSSQRKISVSLRTNGAIQLKGTGARSPRSAAQDPAFQTAVVKKTKAIAKQQKHHAPAKTKAAEAQAAAQPPANDLASKAAGKQVQQMDQQQPKPFNRAAFKAALLAKIAAAAPKNLKEADEFKESGKVSGVKGELTGQVDSSKKQSGGAIESQVKATPNPSGIETKVATPLPPTTEGAPPEAIDSTQASPKPKTADEVSLQEGSQSLDRQMTEAKVTEEQLKKSNEPDFQAAADAKKGAQADAVKAPMEFRKSEQASLNQAKTQAGTTAQAHLTGMRGTRGQLLNRVTGSQQQTKGEEEKQEALVANEVQGIYAQTKQKAEARLARLDTEVNQAFDQGATSAQQAFEDYVKRRMDDYKDKRYSGLDGAALWLRDKFLGVPSEVNQFFVEGRGLYIAKMDGVLDRVAALVETGLNEAKNEIATGRKAVQEHIQRRLKDFPEAAKRATEKIKGQFDQLEQSVDDKQNQLIDSLAQKYNEKLQAIDARIDEMKAQNKGLVDAAKEAIGGAIKTIMEMKAMLLGILSKAADAIDKIIKDPIAFLGNLVTGVKQGFLNFVGNIASHLQKGLMGWLLGALAETGIQLPESFDLKGIISLVMQVLGLTWAFIRSRAVKLLGEKVVKVLEMVAEPIKILITQGPAGLWEYIKDQLSTLKDTVIEGIKSFVTESIIKAGVTWIIGLLNPAGAFIKACKAIYDIVMFFVERGSQIITLVNAVVDSISAIANGATGVAAGLVENALSKALPVVISFLAALLGVSGITEKIRAIIAKVQAPVHKAIDWVIDKAVSLVKKAGKLLGFGKDKNDKLDERTDEKKKADLDKGLSEGDALLNASEVDIEQVKKNLLPIKNKYKLSKLELVIDSESGDEGTVHLEGEVNPKGSKPKHKVKKGGPDDTISEQDLTFSRPSFRPSTKKILRTLHIKQDGSKNIFKDKKGAFKSDTKWHRRHVVPWGNIRDHFIEVFRDKTVKDAAAILAPEGYSGKLERREVVRYIKEKARNAFNDETNLFIDLGKDNSSLQDVLDDAHPEVLDAKGKSVEAKINEKVADFISKHAIGGHTFKVTTKVGVIDWDVSYE